MPNTWYNNGIKLNTKPYTRLQIETPSIKYIIIYYI